MRYATLWARCWCLIGSVGVGLALLVWNPLSVLSVFLTAAVCCGILLVLLSPANEPQTAMPTVAWARIATRAAVIGAAVVAVSASMDTVPYLALPLVGLAVVSSPWVVERLEEWRKRGALAQARPRSTGGAQGPRALRRPDTDTPAPPPVRLPLDEMRAKAEALSNAELCRAWRRSFVALESARTFAARCEVVAQRQVYLDEMDRRSPSAFQAWLASGARAAGGPDRYLSLEERHDGHSDAA
jgi:hypothetical protein